MFDSYSVCIDLEATGRKIKELRNKNKLRVSDLAEILHSSENTIFKWQRGECLPSMDNLVVLKEVFNTSMDEIIQLKGRDEESLPFDVLFPTVLLHYNSSS